MEAHICSRCGGPLEKKDGFYICHYCRAEYEDDTEERAAIILKGLLDEAKLEALGNARRALYDQVHRENPSEKKTLACIYDVLNLYPDDILARFYDAVLDEDPTLVNELLCDLETDEPIADEIIRYGIKGLKLRNVMALKDFAERNLDDRKKIAAWTEIEAEAAKLDDGIYSTAVPRDVFLAYSSADQDRIAGICDFLEAEGFTVFVAYRNLRHGVGAQEDYLTALYDALDHCKVFLFLSSNHSRSLACDALRVEAPYVTDHLPDMKRIEYILDDYSPKTPMSVKMLLKKAFPTEWCTTRGDLVQRIVAATTQMPVTCPACLLVNPYGSAYCARCGEPLSEEAKQRKAREEAEAAAKPAPQKKPKAPTTKAETEGLEPQYECLYHPIPSKDGQYVYYGVYPKSKPRNPVFPTDLFDGSDYALEDHRLYAKIEGEWWLAEPLRWKVLGPTRSGTLLVTEEIVDAMEFSDFEEEDRPGEAPNDWSKSHVREFLNSTFLGLAFPRGHDALKTTEVDMSPAAYGSDSIKYVYENTFDKVFLLSRADMVNSFFADSEARIAEPTAFSRGRGLAEANYLLRTYPTYMLGHSYIDLVGDNGSVGCQHTPSRDERPQGIRPAVVLDL